MNEIEEQPYDGRNYTLTNPRTGEELSLLGPEFGEARPPRLQVVGPSIEWAGVGLQWVAGPNARLVDIGRAFSSPDALENMHVVDLRTILAHLDSAAKAIVTELESRGAAR